MTLISYPGNEKINVRIVCIGQSILLFLTQILLQINLRSQVEVSTVYANTLNSTVNDSFFPLYEYINLRAVSR